jgi:outer membrane protein assembly factor BamD
MHTSRLRAWPRLLAAVALLASAVACTGGKFSVPEGSLEADKLLFERGTEALARKKWLTAREYFRQITEGYPQSPYRAEAKLGVGDTHLGEGTTEGFVLAVNEYREFLTFFPTHPRADYAQYKLAMAYYHQMPKPERDQTNSKEALKEFEAFFERFPKSALAAEAKTRERESRDRVSESEYRVGLFYYRSKWYPGAIDRLQSVLKSDPEFTNRDAVYFYLAESLAKVMREAEALPYMERILTEFEQSEYLEKARLRVAELKASVPAAKPAEDKPADPKPPDAKPGETKPGETKPVEVKPGQTKPGETKRGETKPGESR